MTSIAPTPISLPQHIDSTMLSAFRSCPRKFFWSHIRGLHPRSRSADLHAGSCFASGLESFYTALLKDGLTVEDSKKRMFGTFTREWGDYVAPDKNPKSQDNMWAALDSYISNYPPTIDRFQFLQNPDGSPTAEFSFAIPLDFDGWPLHPSGEPFFYVGRTDGLGTYDGKLCFKDEKTTKGIGNSWASQWALRGQFIGYTWAGRMSGLEIDSVLVRGVGILMREIKQIEILKTYSQTLRDRWMLQLRHDLHRLVKAWDEAYFDMNFADACSSYNGCAYVPLCESPNPEAWTDNYAVRHWNPLAKVPIDEIHTTADSKEAPAT